MYLIFDRGCEQYLTDINNDTCSWSDYTDQEEVQSAALFKTQKAALHSIDNVIQVMAKEGCFDGDFSAEDMRGSLCVVKKQKRVNASLSLTEDELRSVISVLETAERRVNEYGSFGDSKTDYNSFAIQSAIKQLKTV